MFATVFVKQEDRGNKKSYPSRISKDWDKSQSIQKSPIKYIQSQ